LVPRVSEPVDWPGRHALVTGAAGFIGRRLVQQLVESGARVWAGVAPDEPPERVAALPTRVERLAFDLRDAAAVQAAVAEAAPQVVFHLAAVGVTNAGIDPSLALAINAGGTVHLLEASKERGVGRIVLVGTCYEYGAREAVEGLDPFNAYAASKVAAWAFGRMYWRACGLPIVTVRPFQVYGPGQPAGTLIPAAIGAALNGGDFPMTPGEQARDFVYVDDVVAGMMAAAEAPGIEGESIDLGTGQTHAIRQAVARIWEIAEARGRMLPGALLYRPGEVMRIVADADRAARLTGWRARVSLEDGLRRTIEAMVKGSWCPP
jgi:nucleoside-diphosphate-sugar epimerase